ncbi:AAA family ATPase [bacterium]|nr:AAA family ATPase [bacterium]
MIKEIKLIKNFGIFKNFSWNEDIDEFKKYNLIYGWNYSGKTTIARVFRSFEVKDLPLDFNDSEFILVDENENEIDQNNLSSHSYYFRVFNIDFIKENLYWDSQEANPLFILGEKDINLEKQLKELRKNIEQLKTNKETKTKEKQKKENEIERALTEKAREIDRIKPPYDKRKLRKVLEEIKDNVETFCLSETDVKNLLRSLRTEEKEKISKLVLNTIPNNLINEITHSFNKTVVSEIIERLRADHRLNNWVREGLEIHKGKNKCEFCGSPLPEGLLERYEKHFSKEYTEFLKKLNRLKDEVEKYKRQVEAFQFPDEKRFYPEFENSYHEAKTKLEFVINEYKEVLEKIIDLINRKIQNPFETITEVPNLNNQTDQVKNKIDEINKIIDKHNRKSEKHKEEQEKVFNKLERHYACEFAKSYNYFQGIKEINQIKKEIDEIEKRIKEKEREIQAIESQLSDVSKAANRINSYLKSIFEKDHLKIQPAGKDKFLILRNGERAKNLSEGEKTAIAFSYFLTRLEDRETDISMAIVFIDDPISSLDSAHLYNTYALIASKLSNCRQLFISTHNLEFFNLIKEWMKKMKRYKEKCGFYLVERIAKRNEEMAHLRNLPDTLLNYKSEYHFLFSKIKSFDENPSTDFDSLYQLPNIIRRFLEAFVGFKYSQGLKKGLELLIDDEAQRIKVDKFLNNLSHQTGLQRNLIFNDLSECESVVNIVLNAIGTKDREHYKALENVYYESKSNS